MATKFPTRIIASYSARSSGVSLPSLHLSASSSILPCISVSARRRSSDSALCPDPDILGLFSINVVSFSRNVVPERPFVLSECGPGWGDVFGPERLCSRSAAQRVLEDRKIGAVNAAVAFPMELDQFPGRGWIVSHKIVAQAAGLGRMGIHRSLIHPKYGSFVLLGTVLIAEDVDTGKGPPAFCLQLEFCGPIVSCSKCPRKTRMELVGDLSDLI